MGRLHLEDTMMTSKPNLGSRCGGYHCMTDSCCLDSLGNENCCYTSLSEEPWFWILVVIGFFFIMGFALCCCRSVYRYHNAIQYTKLRQQQPTYYGTVRTVPTVHPPPLVPPPVSTDNSQPPSYLAVIGRPPPYSEI